MDTHKNMQGRVADTLIHFEGNTFKIKNLNDLQKISQGG